jgi:hypothetical protein
MDIIEQVKASDVFKAWKEKHKDAFLGHVFVTVENEKPTGWQAGYVEGEAIVPFSVVDDGVVKGERAEMFRKPGSEPVKALDSSKVRVTLPSAVEKAIDHQREKYPAEQPQKTICILQHVDEGQVWNITFVTASFKTLNVRVDAASGKIVAAKLLSLFDIQPGKK